MPFYSIATTLAEKREILLLFLASNIKSLMIIEKNSRAAQSIIETLHAEGDLSCNIKLTSGCETYTFEGISDMTKKIILHTGLDGYAIHQLTTTKPTLAIFF